MPSETPPPDTGPQDQPSQAGAQSAHELPSVDLLFDTDSAHLANDAYTRLKPLAQWAKCNAKGAVILDAHADDRGTVAYNMELSGQRAAAVQQKLVAMGVPADRIIITVYGKTGATPTAQTADRRVTVTAAETPLDSAAVSVGARKRTETTARR